MAINFPNNPALNDTFTVGGITFTWNGSVWNSNVSTEISSDSTPQLGGALDAATNNINNVGVITATTFSGNLTGNADTATAATTATTATTATNAQGLTGTPNITVGTVGCSTVTSTGDVTGVNATFSGNLTVNGTTTTIDTAVTSVDSIAVDGAGTFGGTVRVNHTGNAGSDQLVRLGNVNNSGTNSAHLFLANGYYVSPTAVDGTSAAAKILADGTATFAGKVDVNNELHVHRSSTTASNALLALHSDIGGTKTRKSTIRADGSAEFSGTISDSMGPLRRLGINAQTGAYTVTTTDAGKLIRINNTGNITIPTGLSPGDMVSIVSHHNSTNTIVQDTGLTMYNTADGSTGNRTLAARGVCTILWSHTDTAYISGSGLS